MMTPFERRRRVAHFYPQLRRAPSFEALQRFVLNGLATCTHDTRYFGNLRSFVFIEGFSFML